LVRYYLCNSILFDTSSESNVGERRAQRNAGLNVTDFYIVSQGQTGCVSSFFLSLPEDRVALIWGNFVKIWTKSVLTQCKYFFHH